MISMVGFNGYRYIYQKHSWSHFITSYTLNYPTDHDVLGKLDSIRSSEAPHCSCGTWISIAPSLPPKHWIGLWDSFFCQHDDFASENGVFWLPNLHNFTRENDGEPVDLYWGSLSGEVGVWFRYRTSDTPTVGTFYKLC